jgi:hypothetical protein
MKKLTEKQEKQQETKIKLLSYNLEELNNTDTFNLLDEFQTLIFLYNMEEKDRKNIDNYVQSEQLQKNIDLINSYKLRLIKSITNL